MIKKTTSVLTFIGLSSIIAIGQERSISKKNVSVQVQNFVEKKYPDGKHLKYYQEKINDNLYIECEFKMDKSEYSLKFLADSLVETEKEIEFTDLPQDEQQIIQSNLDSLFTRYKILECQIVNPEKNPVYELNIKTKSGQYFELFFENSGKLLTKTEIIIKPISSQF